jgi:hypothetical protein
MLPHTSEQHKIGFISERHPRCEGVFEFCTANLTIGGQPVLTVKPADINLAKSPFVACDQKTAVMTQY